MSARKVVAVLAVLLIAGLLAAGCPKPEAGPTPPVKPAVLGKGTFTAPSRLVYFDPKDVSKVSEKPGPGLVEGLYQCPMHPEVVASEPGKCPKCGMEMKLVTKDEAMKAYDEKGTVPGATKPPEQKPAEGGRKPEAAKEKAPLKPS